MNTKIQFYSDNSLTKLDRGIQQTQYTKKSLPQVGDIISLKHCNTLNTYKVVECNIHNISYLDVELGRLRVVQTNGTASGK